MVYFAAGLVLLIAASVTDIRFWLSIAYPAYVVSLILLVAVIFVGHSALGAQRWLSVGPIEIQPSELMKIALVLALASWFHRASWERIGNPLFLITPIIAVVVPVGLILKEPNLGTAVVVAVLGGAMFFVAGVRWWKFVLVALPIPFAAPERGWGSGRVEGVNPPG
jgi:rod shape determining protein RodA